MSNAHVIFEAHDGADYEVYYTVTGPAISVDPSSYDFGSVNVGSSASYTFSIYSVGTEDLSITDFTLSDTTDYTLDANGCGSLPVTLSPGNSCTVSVTFNPTTAGSLDANLTMDSNDSGNATFTVSLSGVGSKYTLAVSKEGTGNGTVTSSPAGIDCGDDCSEGYDPDTTVTLTATAGTESYFVSWDGCDSAVGNECTMTMNANKEVTATFTLNAYTLTVEKAGTGSGSVTSSPVGIDCGLDCSEDYEYGTTVILTPVEGLESIFTGWEGCDSVEGSDCTVTIAGNRTATATFTLNTYTLTVEKAGSGDGTVISSPAGIDCQDDCSEVYGYGTTIVLTATPSAASSFDSWEGCDSVNGNECTITVSADATVTATFSHIAGDVFVCPTGCDHDSIQAAIDASGAGDTIKVAQGIYHEIISIADSKEFTLQGGWNSTFTTKTNNPALTVIDGEIEDVGAGSYSVLAFDAYSGVSINATIENLTLRNGNQSEGGGVYAVAHDSGTLNLTLLKNVIRDNQATDGGGIYVSSASSGEIQLTMINNLIFNNSAPYGAGIFAVAGDSSSLTASLIFNTITDNDADTGGGLYALSEGGTLSVWVNNSILWGNSALTSGDDIFMVGVNTTVNTSLSDIGVWVNEGDSATYTEDTNINDDPIFVNPALGNYRLNSDSPCRDAGTPVELGEPALVGFALPDDDFEGEVRPQGSGYDIGADEFAMVFKKVKVLAFNGGEFLPTGQTHTITWGAPAAATKFNLSYTIDNGLTWKSIEKGITGNHYGWTVPILRNNKKAKVKVVGFNSKSINIGADTSDATFTIGVVRVLSPNGGEELFSGDSWPVYWETNATVAEVNQVELYYTTNGGTTWKFIDNPTEEGYYKWYPEVLADKTKCKLKVVLKDAEDRVIGSDMSDKVFTIRAGR